MKKTTTTARVANSLRIALIKENKAWEKYVNKLSETAAAHREFLTAQVKVNKVSSRFYKIKA